MTVWVQDASTGQEIVPILKSFGLIVLSIQLLEKD